MTEKLSRKQFFRHALMQMAQFSSELHTALHPFDTLSSEAPDDHLGADLPPELLIAEAERLGIDPSDKAAVVAALAEKLQQPQP